MRLLANSSQLRLLSGRVQYENALQNVSFLHRLRHSSSESARAMLPSLNSPLIAVSRTSTVLFVVFLKRVVYHSSSKVPLMRPLVNMWQVISPEVVSERFFFKNVTAKQFVVSMHSYMQSEKRCTCITLS